MLRNPFPKKYLVVSYCTGVAVDNYYFVRRIILYIYYCLSARFCGTGSWSEAASFFFHKRTPFQNQQKAHRVDGMEIGKGWNGQRAAWRGSLCRSDGRITVGVCAREKKARSKHMEAITSRLHSEKFEVRRGWCGPSALCV